MWIIAAASCWVRKENERDEKNSFIEKTAEPVPMKRVPGDT